MKLFNLPGIHEADSLYFPSPLLLGLRVRGAYLLGVLDLRISDPRSV